MRGYKSVAERARRAVRRSKGRAPAASTWLCAPAAARRALSSASRASPVLRRLGPGTPALGRGMDRLWRSMLLNTLVRVAQAMAPGGRSTGSFSRARSSSSASVEVMLSLGPLKGSNCRLGCCAALLHAWLQFSGVVFPSSCSSALRRVGEGGRGWERRAGCEQNGSAEAAWLPAALVPRVPERPALKRRTARERPRV